MSVGMIIGETSATDLPVGSGGTLPTDYSYSGDAASSPLPAGGGSTLNELGTFFGQVGTSVSSIIHAVNTPQQVQVPRSNLPFASATQGVRSSTSILTLILFGVLIFFGFKALKR